MELVSCPVLVSRPDFCLPTLMPIAVEEGPWLGAVNCPLRTASQSWTGGVSFSKTFLACGASSLKQIELASYSVEGMASSISSSQLCFPVVLVGREGTGEGAGVSDGGYVASAVRGEVWGGGVGTLGVFLDDDWFSPGNEL